MSRLRKFFIQLHLYVGLLVTLTIIVIAATGCILTFEREIDQALHPKGSRVAVGTTTVPLTTMIAAVRQVDPNAQVQLISYPAADDRPYLIGVMAKQYFVNGYTGQIVEVREGGRQTFLGWVIRLHRNLAMGAVGRQIVGYSTLLEIFLIVTGLIIWWPRKIVTVRPASGWKRLNFDLHNISGFFSCVVVVLIAVTGLFMTFGTTLRPWLYKVTGPPVSFKMPAVKTPEGLKPLETEQILRLADTTRPDERVASIVFPTDNKPLIRVLKRPPGQTKISAQLFLNKYTGQVEAVQNLPPSDAASVALSSIVPIHTGDIYGWPTRIIVFLSSLTVVLQTVTGFIIWFVRQKPKRPRAA
jgi:uncharacterized iron-regulated membrane protein